MLTEIKPTSLKDKTIDALLQSAEYVFSKIIPQIINTLIYPRIDELSGEILDLLAWQFHVEGWELARSLEEKKALIKQAIDLHKLKGTPAGIKLAAFQAGSKVLRLIEPPNKFFLSPALTYQEKNAWLRKLPQLRIYPQRKRAKRQGPLFWKDYLSYKLFPLRTDAIFRMTARSVLWREQRETDLVTPFWETDYITKGAKVEVFVPGRAGWASFLNRPLSFVTSTDASLRSFTIAHVMPYVEEKRRLQIKTLKLEYKPVHIDAEWEAEQGKQRSLFLNSAKFYYLAQTNAMDRLYWKVYLYDPSVTFTKALSPNHLGVTRLGFPAYNCEVLLDLTDKKHYFPLKFLSRYTAETAKTKLQKVCKHISDYNRASVRILVDTKKFKPIKAYINLTASEKIIAGQYKEVS